MTDQPAEQTARRALQSTAEPPVEQPNPPQTPPPSTSTANEQNPEQIMMEFLQRLGQGGEGERVFRSDGSRVYLDPTPNFLEIFNPPRNTYFSNPNLSYRKSSNLTGKPPNSNRNRNSYLSARRGDRNFPRRESRGSRGDWERG